jgi:hypothetical protein
MSSMACRFVGSAIATMSDAPERETGTMLVLLADLLRDELHHVGVELVVLEVDRGTRYCAERKFVISPSEM